MDITNLQSLIRTALSNPVFEITSAALESSRIARLFNDFFQTDRLRVNSAQEETSGANSVSLSGQLEGAILDQQNPAIQVVFSIVDENVEVRISTRALPPDWTPQSALPDLRNSIYSFFDYQNGSLSIDSQITTLPNNFPTQFGHPEYSPEQITSFKFGLRYEAEIKTKDADVWPAWLLGQQVYALSGSIALQDDRPLIWLDAPARPDHSFAEGGFRLSFAPQLATILVFEESDEPSAINYIQLDSEINKELAADRTIQLPVYVRSSSLRQGRILINSRVSDGQDRPISLTQIPSLIDGFVLDDQIPDTFPALDAIRLEAIRIWLNVAEKKVESLSATIVYNNSSTSWSQVENLLSFENLRLSFSMIDPTGLQLSAVSVGADGRLAGGLVKSHIFFPEIDFFCELTDGSISISELFANAVGSSVDLGTVACSELQLYGVLRSELYHFKAVVTNDWSLSLGGATDLSLTEVRLQIGRQLGIPVRTSGEITGKLRLAGIDFFATAATEDPSLGWTFSAGTAGLQQINMTRILGEASDVFGINFPANAPDFSIRQLHFSFNSQTKDFSFLCQSELDLSGLQIQLLVEVANVVSTSTRTFRGYLTLAESRFEIDFLSSPQQTELNASWEMLEEQTLSIGSLVGELFDGAELPHGFPDIGLSSANLNIHPDTGEFSMSLSSLSFWEIDVSVATVKIGPVNMNLSRLQDANADPADTDPDKVLSYSLSGGLQIGEAGSVFTVTAAYDGKETGWSFSGRADNIHLGELLSSFFSSTEIPSAISSFTADEVELEFNSKTRNFSFNFLGHITSPASASVNIKVELTHHEDGSYEQFFSGEITVGAVGQERIFDLIFDHQDLSSDILMAIYRKPGGEQIQFSSLIPGLPNIPFKIKDGLFALVMDGDAHKYLLTADMDFGLDLSGLSNLPLIGKGFSAEESLKLSFQPIFAPAQESEHLTADNLKAINQLLPDGMPKLPEEISGDFELLTTLHMGDKKVEVPLRMNQSDYNSHHDLGTTDPTADIDPDIDPGADMGGGSDVQWVDLQKHFGPLEVSRVGMLYENPKISFLLDAGLTVGPLDIAVEGLGAQYNLSNKSLGFTLSGLGVNFKKDPLEIGGSFLRLADAGDFAGRVKLSFKAFSLTALGAYGEHGGHPSMFLYAFLNYPLGGPAFFFVEGLALGFGYNRRLKLPTIDKIHSFPLISEVIGESTPAPGLSSEGSGLANAIRREMHALENYLSPEVGQYFVAAGVKFSSFKMIDSFALLSISFGNRLDLAVMGVSRMVIPTPDAGRSLPLIAKIEMEFLAHFVPQEGLVSAQANLTPNSYLLTKECTLHGGYAFFSWLSGAHSGDFVATLGGYHPHFQVPKHYPQSNTVPRLGFHWQINKNAYIKGGVYYALTPHAVMAGGSLEAHYSSSGTLYDAEAHFSAGANFLINWKPFHYEANFHIDVGGSLTIYFFGTHHISLDASADVYLWGPELAASAHIELSVLGVDVDFDARFGAARFLGEDVLHPPARTLPALIWTDFKASFLPADLETKACSIAVRKGLIRAMKLDGGAERWVVNAKDLELQVDSVIPLTQKLQLYKGSNISGDDWTTRSSEVEELLGEHTIALGIDPMRIAKEHFHSKAYFRLRNIAKGSLLNKTQILDEFSIKPLFKSFPKAVWTDELSSGNSPSLNGEQMIEGLAGYTLHPKNPSSSG